MRRFVSAASDVNSVIIGSTSLRISADCIFFNASIVFYPSRNAANATKKQSRQ